MSDPISITIDADADTLHRAAEHLRGSGPSRLPEATITELCELRASAKAAAEMFSEAIAEQAEKHDLKRSSLRRYICAREADKLFDLDAEVDELATLMLRDGDA